MTYSCAGKYFWKNHISISPEHTELDEALQDIMERSEEAQEELAKGEERKEKNAEKEKETVENVRKRSM